MCSRNFTVKILEYPKEKDWMEVKRRALVTVGKNPVTPPTSKWKHAILEARHSPIRYLRYSFLLENIPYWVAMHIRTHVHDTPNGDEFFPYIKSQRDDRQSDYKRGKAPQDQPVNMILDVSGEQIQNFANKRLCKKSSDETRAVVKIMCKLAEKATPELKGLLVPACLYHGGVCHEMEPCNLCETED